MVKVIENININGVLYELAQIYSKMGMSFDRFVELIERDSYCPVLSADPSDSVVSYTDTDGSVNDFRQGQFALVPSGSVDGGYKVWMCLHNDGTKAVWRLHDKALTVASEAMELASAADIYAREAHTVSGEAARTADAARQAVATLQGLSNTTEAQQTLAAQVMQIAQNTSDVAQLKQQHVVLSEEEFEALDLVDQDKIYMITEE